MEASVHQNEAVNNVAPVAESAPVANQEQVLTPPLEGNTSEPKVAEKAVPYDRFKEVIEDRNYERANRQALEMRLQELQTPKASPIQSQVEAAVKEYVANGLKEDAARALVNNQMRLGDAQQAEIKAELHGYKVNEWTRELKEQYKDYADVSAEADKEFSNLSPQEKQSVMSSRRALHTFFKSVRSDVLEKKLANSFNEGANMAYQNKQVKQGMGNTPGKAPGAINTAITREAIAKMSPAEFQKRLPEINAALMKGDVK